MERADEKKPTEVGGIDAKPFVSDAMREAGWDEVERLADSLTPDLLAEAVYIAMAAARPLALRLAERDCLSAPSVPANASNTR